MVEEGAGVGSGFSDETYAAVGARVAGVEEVWSTAELLLKVKEPIASEYGYLRENLTLFTYLHIAADEPLTRALLDSGIAAVAYETVETADRRLPLLAPMSEVAGRLAPQMGAWALEKAHGGRGILLGGVPGVPPAKVIVLGGGVVGINAAIIALGMQADVWVLDTSVDRMRELEIALDGRVTLAMSNRLQIEEVLPDADLVIGAVLITMAFASRWVARMPLSFSILYLLAGYLLGPVGLALFAPDLKAHAPVVTLLAEAMPHKQVEASAARSTKSAAAWGLHALLTRATTAA